MRSTRPPSPVAASPNVTPMIDVMLTLLVVFMVVVPVLAAEEFLPHADNGDPLEADQGQTIRIDRVGIWVNGHLATAGQLASALGPGHGPAKDRGLVLIVDRRVPFQSVKSVIEVVSQAGVTWVTFVTAKSQVGY